MTCTDAPGQSSANGRRHRRGPRIVLLTIVTVGFEAACLWLRAGRIGGRVVVRCRDGHLFTTLWIPGASLKALRLGWWRVQRCPVAHHWSIVTPVRDSALSEADRALARGRRDTSIP